MFLPRFFVVASASILSVQAFAVTPRQAASGLALSGKRVSFGGGWYPRANRLQDGSILGALSVETDGNTVLTTVTSTDNGATWGPLGTIASRPSATSDIDNPYPLQLPNGTILAAYRNHDKDASGKYTYFRIDLSSSQDGGKTWEHVSAPSRDTPPAGYDHGDGNWEPFLSLAGDNKTVHVYYSRNNNGYDQDNIVKQSTDSGLTWGDPMAATGGLKQHTRDGMFGCTNAPGGGLIAVFESASFEPGAKAVVTQLISMTSTDGVTWKDRNTVYTSPANNNAGSPQILNVGGKLIVTFMTDEDTSKHKWTEGANVKALMSSDGGKTWGSKVTVGDVQSNWPGLVDGGDGKSIWILYENSGSWAQKLTIGADSGYTVSTTTPTES